MGGIILSEDRKHLYLLNADYRSALTIWEAPRSATSNLASQTVRFLKDAVADSFSARLSPDARAVAETLKQAWKEVETVTVSIFTDGVFDGKEIRLSPIEQRPANCEIFDLRGLHRLTDRLVRRVDVDFKGKDGSPITRLARSSPDPSYECSLLIVPGAFLASLYDEYDVALLEYNVREFLGSSNKVNAGIRRTLKSQPHRFLAYNNGLSATAKSVEMTENGSAVRRVEGLQIVNGGQTLAALHHVMYKEKVDISAVEVAFKLTVVKDADEAAFVGEVSSYANTQSIVQLADFSANRPYHIDIERLSRSVWVPGEKRLWFFERTRGQYNVACTREGTSAAAKRRFKDRYPPALKFSKTDVAKFEHAWGARPHSVCNGAQYNYQSWLETEGREEWTPDQEWYKSLVARAIIFKAAQRGEGSGSSRLWRSSRSLPGRSGERSNRTIRGPSDDLAETICIARVTKSSRPMGSSCKLCSDRYGRRPERDAMVQAPGVLARRENQ